MEKINVLLVEDEGTLAMIIKETLESQDFVIHTANDGMEGLRRFFDLRPDVVVADVMMPHLDGFEIGDYRFNAVTQRLSHAGTETELSHRGADILKQLCENRNQVVSSQGILLDLWGDDSFFNSRSLHVFITKLRHKLAKDGRIRIVNVRGIGYKLIVN